MNEELHAEYIASLQKRIERIESLSVKLTEGNAKAEENIRLIAHSLHGSGVTFGFPEISEAGKAVEHAESADLESSLEALKAVLEKVVADNGGGLKQGALKQAEEKPQEKNDAGAARQTSKQTSDEDKALKILVVEDDSEMAALITSMLQSLPKKLEIKLAGTAAKAQEEVVKGRFDLIIMDLVLPDRDGRELIQEIKLEFRLSTPLLVLSGIGSDAVRVECMSLGADKYVTKPFYDDELMGEVKKLLGKKIKKKLTLVPLEGEEPEEEPEEDLGPGPLKGKTILLAEDDKMQAKLITERLKAQSAIVKHCNNGREAMQLLRTQDFSLLILDVKMPVMDGFEVLQRARGELDLDIPIIMVTAMGSEADIIRGYDMGATDYILKPFSEVQLVARVKSLLKK